MYSSGEYIQNHPTLHVEDTPWKLEKILPGLDSFIKNSIAKDIKLLDVGGGAGLILKGVADYLREENINVKKYALDLSTQMLQIQKEHNPDIITLFEGGIEKTSFRDKEIDLALVIDVLEHVPDPAAALEELRRVADYVIFKVPMESNLFYNVLNILKRGGLRRDMFQKVGHVQFYHSEKLKAQLRRYTGEILYFRFSNAFGYMLSKDYHRKLTMKEKGIFSIANAVYSVSPILCSWLFQDSVVCLVKCR